MAKRSIEESTLTNIADPIRTLMGLSGVITPEGMKELLTSANATVDSALAAIEEKGVDTTGAVLVDIPALVAAIKVGEGDDNRFVELVEGVITEAVDTRIETIREYAFHSCATLVNASFPACASIGKNAFYSCASLTNAEFPACETIGNWAFGYCAALTNVVFPACANVMPNAFASCSALANASFPVCSSINSYVFAYCKSLSNVSFPACTSVGSYAFAFCSALKCVSFPVCADISGNVFRSCVALSALILAGSSVCSLKASNAFASTPIYSGTGYIYVPSSLVASYKAATNWAYYSNQISAIEDSEFA